MKIVILDGFTLNPGDLSWADFKSLAKCEIHDRTAPEDTVKRSQDAEIIITNKTVISRDIIGKLPQLKYIGVLATGYNVVDIDAAKEKGIIVTNIPAYSTKSVAQLTFAHILNLTQRVKDHAESVRFGDWCKSKDFSYWNFNLIELSGLTLGIIGLGNIGRQVAKLANAFGMKVIAYNKRPKKSDDFVEMVSLEDAFSQSDFLSLHCPLNSDTEKLVNRERLSLMKKGSFLINTSRGGLIDEQALDECLEKGIIAGAGLDVLSTEPPLPDNPLLTARNCYVTPHIAWATRAARSRLMQTAVENIKAFLDGNPQNIIKG